MSKPETLRDSLGRKRYPHKYQFGKPNEPITPEDLRLAIQEGYFAKPLPHKSYLILTVHIGSRKGELLECVKEDFDFQDEVLILDVPAFKWGERAAGGLDIPLSWFGMDIVRAQWKKARKGKRVWRFSRKTAWRIFKRVFPKKSPHHARWTFITAAREAKDRGELSTDDIKAWTGIKRDSTIEGYGLKTQAGVHKVSQAMHKIKKPGKTK